MSLLAVENLEVAYARVILAVQGVSLAVPERSIVALLGTNGAGKTTTVRAITGFLPVDDAQIRKGDIRLAGESIAGLPPYRIAARGAVLVPERDKIFQTLTVEDNLRLPLSRRRQAGEAGIDKVLQIFPALARRRSQVAGLMSGGERQMLAIAQGLLCNPKVLVVDELSLGLAPHLVAELMAQLKGLRDDLGVSILLVEQDAASALTVADFGYVMEGGRIVYEGAPDKLRGHKDIQEFYLGSSEEGRASYRDVKQYRRARRWWG
ncbi:MAG TPA: ABC transporter ATP-binding protein [Burkholderiales bacterium]|nr:ABC transporter ATP-binding protein [Burkholderiales bacterium]